MTVALDIRDDDGKAAPRRVILTRRQVVALIRHLQGPKGNKALAAVVREAGRRIRPGRPVVVRVIG